MKANDQVKVMLGCRQRSFLSENGELFKCLGDEQSVSFSHGFFSDVV